MLAMTRLQTDSFLPSGAMRDPRELSMSYNSHVNGHLNSVISPLSLSNTANQFSYFEDSHHPARSPPNFAYPPAGAAAPRSQQYLSPRQSSPAACDPRSSSLSPTRYRTASGLTSPSMAPTSHPGVSSPLTNMSNQQVVDLLQRREEHNRRLLESWQNERAHLEASRARAEEMFREERDLMDQERLLWNDEKEKLHNEIFEWKRRVVVVEKERDNLANLHQSMTGGIRQSDRAADVATDGCSESIRGGSSGSPGAGAPPIVRFSNASSLSPRSIPSITSQGSTMPESQPFVPLDPRMQSASPTGTKSPVDEEERVPSIDVNQIIPELEGIRLKAPAVQRPTFMDGRSSPPSVGSKSPPAAALNRESPKLQSRTSPIELAKELLQAPEARRLTMHAGHTPNHSITLSELPTIDSTRATNTAGSSGTSTPTCPKGEESHGLKGRQPEQESSANEGPISGHPDTRRERHDSKVEEGTSLEPSEGDRELKGPLRLLNRPAADEVFLRRLSDKLELVKAQDTPPAAVMDASEPFQPALRSTQPNANARTGTDEAHDVHEEPAEDIEKEIPLKLRKTNNFGQPLGQLGPQRF
ncbi:hypothetical protein GGR56DRAFT_468391 [Xylariaceae sp. FL0804]|nr:hypothetical protein GGR56DRAFT_468391 [Xylariaceae sp. FL0804]